MRRPGFGSTGLAWTLGLGLWLLVAAVPVLAAGPDLEDLLFDLQLIPLDGQAPPPFTLESLEGKRVSLSDFRRKPVLLYFWATW
jgi:cytochrome oxidase Cu insertion factor (SCO1/SenC/PrrC family)